MRLYYVCPCCNKEFSKKGDPLAERRNSKPIMCPHCKEVIWTSWKKVNLLGD